MLGGNPRCFYFQVCFFILLSLGACYFYSTPLYLYFQVLCKVLASNGRKSKSYGILSRNRFCTLHWKIPRKSPDHLFDPNFLHSMLQAFSLISLVLNFSNLTNRSASINSNSADYPVLADCSLVFQSYLLKIFNLGSLLKVPWFELSNSSLLLFWGF